MTIDTSALLKKMIALVTGFIIVYVARDFLIPLAIALVFATLFLPGCRWLERRGFPRAVAALSCLLVFVTAIGLITFIIGWQVSNLADDLPLLKQKALTIFSGVEDFMLRHTGISLKEQVVIFQTTQSPWNVVAQSVVGSGLSLLMRSVLVLAYIFFLLYYRSHILTFLCKITSAAHQPEMKTVVSNVAHVSHEYMLGLIKMIVLLWVMYGIGFSVLGLKHALFFAVACGLLEIIPFIGNITGTTIAILVSLMQGSGLPVLAGIIGTYLLIQLIQGWVLEPLILGPQVKINPFATVLALVIGDLVWGLPGVFLAIPLVAMAKILFDHINSLKAIGFLIGPADAKEHQKEVLKINFFTPKSKS